MARKTTRPRMTTLDTTSNVHATPAAAIPPPFRGPGLGAGSSWSHPAVAPGHGPRPRSPPAALVMPSDVPRYLSGEELDAVCGGQESDALGDRGQDGAAPRRAREPNQAWR